MRGPIIPFGTLRKICGCYLVRFYMFFNFYHLDLHDKTHVALATLRLNMCKNHIKIGPLLI